MIKHFSAGGVLLNDKNEVFLIHKIERSEWALPKGTIEEGEDIIDAALREIKEETGYEDIQPITDEPIFTDKYYTKHPKTQENIDKTVYFFIFRVQSSQFETTKEMEVEGIVGRWFSISKAITQLTFENQRNVVKKAQEVLAIN